MENPSAPLRSLDRDGKLLYITFLHLSSLTRRKRPWKIRVHWCMWDPPPPRGMPRRISVRKCRHHVSVVPCQLSNPLRRPSSCFVPRQPEVGSAVQHNETNTGHVDIR